MINEGKYYTIVQTDALCLSCTLELPLDAKQTILGPGGGGMGTPIDGQKEIGLPGLVSPYL